MRKERISPSISYLIELVVAILFFAASCVICVNIFYQASTLSKATDLRFVALNKAQQVAEQAIASKEMVETGTWYTDASWNEQSNKRDYRLKIKEVSQKNSVHTYTIQMHKADKQIAKITFSVLVEEERT